MLRLLSNSWSSVILLPHPSELLGLQMRATQKSGLIGLRETTYCQEVRLFQIWYIYFIIIYFGGVTTPSCPVPSSDHPLSSSSFVPPIKRSVMWEGQWER